MQNCADTELHPGRFWPDTFLHLLSYFCSLSNEFRNLAIFQASKPCKLNNLGLQKYLFWQLDWGEILKERKCWEGKLFEHKAHSGVSSGETDRHLFRHVSAISTFYSQCKLFVGISRQNDLKTTEQVINHVISVQMPHFLSCFLSLLFRLQFHHDEISIFPILLWQDFVFMKIW